MTGRYRRLTVKDGDVVPLEDWKPIEGSDAPAPMEHPTPLSDGNIKIGGIVREPFTENRSNFSPPPVKNTDF